MLTGETAVIHELPDPPVPRYDLIGVVVVAKFGDGAAQIFRGNLRRLAAGNARELNFDAKMIGKQLFCPPFVLVRVVVQRTSTDAPLNECAPWLPDLFTELASFLVLCVSAGSGHLLAIRITTALRKHLEGV